jgi:hypothetical protein
MAITANAGNPTKKLSAAPALRKGFLREHSYTSYASTQKMEKLQASAVGRRLEANSLPRFKTQACS